MPTSTSQIMVKKKVSAINDRSTQARILAERHEHPGQQYTISTYFQKYIISCGASARRLKTTRQMLGKAMRSGSLFCTLLNTHIAASTHFGR